MLSFLSSSVLNKIVVAVTGLVLVGFVTGHMLGHTLMFVGQDAYNTYAQNLQNLGPLLWGIRIFLLVCAVLHIIGTINLANKNKNAKAIGYSVTKYQNSTFSSRFMVYAGLAILFFVIYHLLHFTFGVVNAYGHNTFDSMQRHDVYSMMILSFKKPIITIVYLLAVGFLGLHLNHGIKSMFQTLGLSNETRRAKFEQASIAVSIIITVGYMVVPLAILLDYIGGNL